MPQKKTKTSENSWKREVHLLSKRIRREEVLKSSILSTFNRQETKKM
jgi:hypothetical protein